MGKAIIRTNNAPAPIGPYNQAVSFGNLLFVSGQIAIDAKDGSLKTGSLEEEINQVMANLQAVLAEACMDFSDVLKATIFLTNMNEFAAINAIYGQFFSEETAPARETVQVAALPKGVRVEISVIAGK